MPENTVSKQLLTLKRISRELIVRLGWVSSIKDQGGCPSCTSFATGGILEGCLAKAGVPLPSLDISEQKILDCARDEPQGCFGTEGLDPYVRYIKGTYV